MSATVTVEGFLSSDPELKYTPNGNAVVKFTIPVNKRKRNESTGQWESVGETTWFNIDAFGELAENITESLRKGHYVQVVANVSTTTGTDQNGAPRTYTNYVASEVNIPLRMCSVQGIIDNRQKRQRSQQAYLPPQGGQGYAPPAAGGYQQPPVNATPAAPPVTQGAGFNDDNPPF